MTGYSRGDVVLVTFVFSDESGEKLRPALVLSSKTWQSARGEVIVLAITSQVEKPRPGDHLVSDWRAAHLLSPSLVTGIVRTVKTSMIKKRLGSLAKADLEGVVREFRRSLEL